MAFLSQHDPLDILVDVKDIPSTIKVTYCAEDVKPFSYGCNYVG